MLAFLIGANMKRDGDEIIDELIKPPRVRFSGFDWNQPAHKLRPNGAGHNDKLIAERYAQRERE